MGSAKKYRPSNGTEGKKDYEPEVRITIKRHRRRSLACTETILLNYKK